MVGEQEDITAFLDPDMPAAGPVNLDADGWGRIDGLGALDCAMSVFNGMKEVPMVHQEKWVRGVSAVLRRIQAAATEDQLTRALKW